MIPTIKRIADWISKHGDEPVYESGYQAWRSSLTSSTWPLIIGRATREYNKLNPYPENFRDMPVAEQQQFNRQRTQDALRWYYENKIDPVVRDGYETKAKMTHSQRAAGTAVVGSVASLVPHPITRYGGLALTIPDQIYDWAELISNPSISNAAHTAIDYPDLIGKAIPGKIDDAILKGLNVLSNVDDAASAAGKDIFSINLRNSPQKRESSSRDITAATESTRVNVPNWTAGDKVGFLYRVPEHKEGGSIHIKPGNKGKFTETMKRTGKSAEELSHSKNPLTRKRAQFAINARKWNHGK